MLPTGFKLPNLDGPSENDTLPHETNGLIQESNHEEHSEVLIDLNSGDEDLEELYDEEYEDFTGEGEFSSSPEEIVQGMVIDTKVNTTNNVTVIKLKVEEELIYLRINYLINDSSRGDLLTASVDSESVTRTKSGILAFDVIEVLEIEPNSNDEIFKEATGKEEPKEIKPKQQKKKKEKKPNKEPKDGFFAKVSKAIQEMKDEMASDKEFIDSDSDYEDDSQNNEKEEKENEKPKKKSSKGNKRRNPLRFLFDLYLKVANLIFSGIKNFNSLMSNIPIIGIPFKLLNKINIVFRWISYLWLIIILLIFNISLSFLIPTKPSFINKPQKQSQVKQDKNTKDKTIKTLKNGDVSLSQNSVTFGDGEVIVNITNSSIGYADFYLTTTAKEKSLIPFVGKKTVCTSPTTVLNVNETKDISLKCGEKIDIKKTSKVDIIIDN